MNIKTKKKNYIFAITSLNYQSRNANKQKIFEWISVQHKEELYCNLKFKRQLSKLINNRGKPDSCLQNFELQYCNRSNLM